MIKYGFVSAKEFCIKIFKEQVNPIIKIKRKL